MLAQAFSKTFSRPLLLFILAAFLLPLAVSAQVNINTADLETLDTLPGVGPVIAQRIIDYRNTNGPFKTIEEIMNVSGIGSVTFSNIKDFITVGSVSSNNQNETSNTTSSITTNTTTTQSSSNTANSSQLSYLTSINIGPDRTSVVGSPVEFRVVSARAGDRGSSFKWNFGDGIQGAGTVVTHVYEYPGDYTVVLTAKLINEAEASAKIRVKVLEAGAVVSIATPERIEVTNSSNHEIDLFGRALIFRDKVFIFPKDTILQAGAQVSFSSKVTGLIPSNLNEVDIVVVGENRDAYKIGKMLDEHREEKISYIKTEIQNLEGKLALARRVVAENNSPAPQVAVEATIEVEGSENFQDIAQTASAINALENSGNGKLDNWFKKLTRFFLGPR